MPNEIAERLHASLAVEEAELAARIGRYPYFHRVEGPTEPLTQIEGRTLINLGSNNYLGLTTDPAVVEASRQAISRWGTGVTGSRLLNGSLELHRQLEEHLAGFYGREAALVFPTGYSANLGLLSGVLGEGDSAFLDGDAHASLIDGVRLARARWKRIEHNNVTRLGEALERSAGTPTAVVVEGVYSMRGDLAALREIAALRKDFGFFLIDDEAHGLGTIGRKGLGAAELLASSSEVDAISLTFSKSLASCGGAVVGDRQLIEALKVTARPFLFTASNTPGSLAAALAALDLLQRRPQMVAELRGRTDFFRHALTTLGVPTGAGESPIVTVPVGSDFRVMQAWRMLWNRHVFCNCIVSPAVPRGKGLLRFSVMRTHSEEHLARAAEACGALIPLLKGEADEDAQASLGERVKEG